MFRSTLLRLGHLVPAVLAALLAVETVAAPPAKIVKPGVEEFQPPPLEEVDAKAGWIDMPVIDALKLLTEKLAAEPAPVSASEALALKNDSDDANRKIIGALGRLPTDSAQVNWDAVITRHWMSDMKSTNPILAQSFEESDFLSLTGAGLFSFDWTLKPFAAAEFVKSWQTSADRLIDKVVMRDDLTWSDGHPLTAHDVQFSFETIMNPGVPVPAMRSGTDKIRAVVAYDDHTLLYFHKEALGSNVWNINFQLIPKHVYESVLASDVTLSKSPESVALEKDPVLGGMYVLKSRVQNAEILLERRESYYMHDGKQVRDKPYFKSVRLKIVPEPATALLALLKGDLDEQQLQPETWMTQTATPEFYDVCTKARDIEWTYGYFGYNQKTPFFGDVRVRKAMAYAMDYDEMLNKLCYGLYQPCQGPFYSKAWMFPPNAAPAYKQDLDKAEDLLDEAGWTDGDGDGIRDKMVDGKRIPFQFTLQCPPIPFSVNLCTLFKENLEKIGVICDVQRVERTVMIQRMLDHEFEAYAGAWGTGADPSTIDNIWETGEQRNFVFYSNPEVDKLLAEGEKAFGRAKQAEIYGRIHSLIYEDQPYTFLYFRSAFYAFNKQLRGYYFSPRGPYHYSPGFSSMWRITTQ